MPARRVGATRQPGIASHSHDSVQAPASSDRVALGIPRERISVAEWAPRMHGPGSHQPEPGPLTWRSRGVLPHLHRGGDPLPRCCAIVTHRLSRHIGRGSSGRGRGATLRWPNRSRGARLMSYPLNAAPCTTCGPTLTRGARGRTRRSRVGPSSNPSRGRGYTL